MDGHMVHAFGDDALGDADAVALAKQVRAGQVSPAELASASAARARKVDPVLGAVAFPLYNHPRHADEDTGALHGVPTFVKDNTDLRGLPTNHGSEAFTARPAKRDGAYATQFLSTGVTVLGKSRMPEFGFNASTEFQTGRPARNPWHTDFSVGASSGGSAALVAAGVVPIAHANDGGGSIRIPAACAGLVGLKPTRGRHRDGEQASHLPLNIISEGVVTRSVRDTAAFVAAAEEHWRNPSLPPIGQVDGPSQRRLRIGLVLDTINDAPVDQPTREAVERVAALLEQAGHVVEPFTMPFTQQFAADFTQYWGLMADLAVSTGKLVLDRSFDTAGNDGLTRGLRALHRRGLRRTPGALWRLRRVADTYASMFSRYELLLSPTLAHTTPRIGELSPTIDFDELMHRLETYVSFTPLNNVAGSPAIAVPAGVTADGLPLSVHFSAAHGDERTLLEIAYTVEAALPFASMTSSSASRSSVS